MKLVNVNYSDFLGGSSIACSRLHEAFISNDVESWIAVCYSNLKQKNVLTFSNKKVKFEYLLKKNLSRIFLKQFEKKNKVDFSLSFFDNPLFKQISLNSFDLVNLHWIGNETLSLKQINKIKKPIVWTLTDMWPFLGAEHINFFDSKNQYYWKDDSMLNHLNYNLNVWTLKRKLKFYNDDIQPVAISRWLADKASQSILFKNKSVKVIPCTLDFDIWKPLENYKLKQKMFEKNKKIILFSSSAGTDDYKKGFVYLVKALKQFKNLDDYHLVILGQLNKKQIEGLNISYTEIPRIFFDNGDELMKIYSSVDLVVMPSIIEAFGQVSVEAAACNVPTIAFKNTGVEEIVEHKKNGYLAEYKNSEDLFYGIKWCLEDKNLNELKQRSRQLAINKFSNKIVVSKYQNLYENLK